MVKSDKNKLAETIPSVDSTYQSIREIVEEEQNGKEKAGYGKVLIKGLFEQLTKEYGRGFNERNLWHIRNFYSTFPIMNALRSELSWTQYLIKKVT